MWTLLSAALATPPVPGLLPSTQEFGTVWTARGSLLTTDLRASGDDAANPGFGFVTPSLSLHTHVEARRVPITATATWLPSARLYGVVGVGYRVTRGFVPSLGAFVLTGAQAGGTTLGGFALGFGLGGSVRGCGRTWLSSRPTVAFPFPNARWVPVGLAASLLASELIMVNVERDRQIWRIGLDRAAIRGELHQALHGRASLDLAAWLWPPIYPPTVSQAGASVGVSWQ